MLLGGECPEVDLESGHEEEHRQQQEHRDLFEAHQDFVAQRRGAVVRHDRAEQEGAEDEVDVELLGGRRRQQQPDQDDATGARA